MIHLDSEVKPQIDIRTALPGPESQKIIEKERKFLATGTKCWETPAVPVEGKGIWFKDADGNTMMDWTNGMVVVLGHSHPKWLEATAQQLQKLVYFNSPDFPNPLQAALAEELANLTPGDFPKKVFFSSSGTEAVEAALKVARVGTRKNIIIHWLGDFHGRSAGSLSTTASKSVHRLDYTYALGNTFGLPYAYCYRCWYRMEYPSCDMHCARILERYFKTQIPPENVAGIIFEPMQGEGGYVIPPREFYTVISEIAEKYGLLLIADEVQNCFGKSGSWFVSEQLGIVPHIIAMAKGLANGAPMGATVFPAEYDFPRQGMHSNTFGGQLLSCASSLATMKIIREQKLLENVRRVGEHFRNRLLEMKDRYQCLGDVRTMGVLIGVEFVKDKKTREPAPELRNMIIEECYKSGLLMIPCGESTIRITPAFVITKEEVDLGLSILGRAIEKAMKA